jgi:hypothetical protein
MKAAVERERLFNGNQTIGIYIRNEKRNGGGCEDGQGGNQAPPSCNKINFIKMGSRIAAQ